MQDKVSSASLQRLINAQRFRTELLFEFDENRLITDKSYILQADKFSNSLSVEMSKAAIFFNGRDSQKRITSYFLFSLNVPGRDLRSYF